MSGQRGLHDSRSATTQRAGLEYIPALPFFGYVFALSRTAFLVVIFPLNLAAGTVLLAVHLLPFGTVQVASIGGALIANLLIDTGLALVGARGLAGGHLT